MSRLRLKTGPVALFCAVFVVALIALLPLRLALGWFDFGDSRLAARDATGSVWWGSVREAQIGGVGLGDLDASLSPWPLFVGRARINLASPSTDATRDIHGAISVSRHAIGIDDMTAHFPAGAAFAPLPIGAIDLDDVSVRFVDGQCETGEGRVKALLDGDVAGIGLAQSMSGTARCDAGALLLPLASQSESEQIALRLWQTGRFRAELAVKSTDATVAQKLELVGFRTSPRGQELVVEGKF